MVASITTALHGILIKSTVKLKDKDCDDIAKYLRGSFGTFVFPHGEI